MAENPKAVVDVNTWPETSQSEKQTEEPKPSLGKIIGFCAALLVMGFIQHFAFAASGVQSPHAMREQMIFRRWLILKLFLSAVGASLLFQSLYCLWGKSKEFDETRFYMHTSVGFPRAIGGCFILGTGMCLSGAGPTVVPTQLGGMVHTAIFVLLGMIVGAYCWAIIEPFAFRTSVPRAEGENTTLDMVFGVSYWVIALPMGIACLVICVFLEIFVSQSEDEPKLHTGSSPLWPTVCGVIVGLFQVPVRIITGDGHGGTTAVMNVVAVTTCGKLSNRHHLTSIPKAYQLIYQYFGGTLGALCCAFVLSGYDGPAGYNILQTTLGGFLMIVGARMANGCTCGNGISGTSELSLQAMCGAAAIFGGGIVMGWFLYAIDVEF